MRSGIWQKQPMSRVNSNKRQTMLVKARLFIENTIII